MKLTSERQWLRKRIQKSKAEPKDKGKEKKRWNSVLYLGVKGQQNPKMKWCVNSGTTSWKDND